MNEEGFRTFLKKQRRSQGTIEQCIRLTGEFEAYLGEHRVGTGLDEAHPEDLEAFVSWKKQQRKSVNSCLWAVHRYYEYTSNEPMRRLATDMRQQAIAKGRGGRRSLRLKNIPGIATEHIEKLAALGITDVEGVLETGRTKAAREELSRRSGVPLDAVLELVKLADLMRIVDIKGIRVRLLYEAGVDTVEKVSKCDPEGLRERIIEVNEEKQILKRHPTLVETRYWITQAKALEKVVEY
jgi:site-specific recombinase XerD